MKLLAKWFGPALLVQVLASIEPGELADRIKPHLETAIEKMPNAWRPGLVLALRKLVDIAAACVSNSKE